MSSDEAIQLTNNDASNFKAYAVSRGYWTDPYVHYFCSTPGLRDQTTPVEHKPPEMSRGYFARVNAIRTIVNKFLSKFADKKCQIINLGAGYDTLYFNLLDKNILPAKYIEIDFARIVMSKIRLIKSKKLLFEKLNPKSEPAEFKSPFLPPSIPFNTEIHTQVYDLVSADLRNLKELDKKLIECKIDFSLPTLIIAECVLVYMNSEHSNALLKYLSEHFKLCCFVNYEQVNLNDKFGEIMLSNMEQRACKLMGIEACNSIDSQFNRFVQNGFDVNTCQIISMTDYYKNKMCKSERTRIEAIEFLDESELLFQLMDHYCVCIAANHPEFKDILI